MFDQSLSVSVVDQDHLEASWLQHPLHSVVSLAGAQPQLLHTSPSPPLPHFSYELYVLILSGSDRWMGKTRHTRLWI